MRRANSVRPSIEKKREPIWLCQMGIKAHIGEVQSSPWDEANVKACEEAGIVLL